MASERTKDNQSRPNKKMSLEERGYARAFRELQKRALSLKGRKIRRRVAEGETFDSPEAEQELEEAGYHKYKEGNRVYLVPNVQESGPARMFGQLRLVDPDTGQLIFEIDLNYPDSVSIHDCRSETRAVLGSGLKLAGVDDILPSGPFFLDASANERDVLADVRMQFLAAQEAAVTHGFIERPATPERYTSDEKRAKVLWKAIQHEEATGHPPSITDLARELNLPRSTVSDLVSGAKSVFYGDAEQRQDELAKLIAEQRADDRSTIGRDVFTPEEGLIEERISRDPLAAEALFESPEEDDLT